MVFRLDAEETFWLHRLQVLYTDRTDCFRSFTEESEASNYRLGSILKIAKVR